MTDKGEVFQTEGREQRHGSRNACASPRDNRENCPISKRFLKRTQI